MAHAWGPLGWTLGDPPSLGWLIPVPAATVAGFVHMGHGRSKAHRLAVQLLFHDAMGPIRIRQVHLFHERVGEGGVCFPETELLLGDLCR